MFFFFFSPKKHFCKTGNFVRHFGFNESTFSDTSFLTMFLFEETPMQLFLTHLSHFYFGNSSGIAFVLTSVLC